MQQLSPASATYSSVVDSFVIRQSQVSSDAAQAASDMNDVMDEMLNRSEIPADYADTMVALFRDKSRGDVIRDFAAGSAGRGVVRRRAGQGGGAQARGVGCYG